MNKRISIFVQEKIPDQYDGYTVQWKEFINTWAKVDFISEDTKDVKYKELIKSFYVFTIRNNKELKMPLKVRYLNKEFTAKKLKFSDNQKGYISIMAEI